MQIRFIILFLLLSAGAFGQKTSYQLLRAASLAGRFFIANEPGTLNLDSSTPSIRKYKKTLDSFTKGSNEVSEAMIAHLVRRSLSADVRKWDSKELPGCLVSDIKAPIPKTEVERVIVGGDFGSDWVHGEVKQYNSTHWSKRVLYNLPRPVVSDNGKFALLKYYPSNGCWGVCLYQNFQGSWMRVGPIFLKQP